MQTQRIFALKAILFSLSVILLLLVSTRLSGRLTHMNATALYSMAPMYGTLKLPNGEEFHRSASAPALKTKKNIKRVKKIKKTRRSSAKSIQNSPE
ncbi:MAG: hypothetical protein AAB489_02635 [Patescibacteria group bacterium]